MQIVITDKTNLMNNLADVKFKEAGKIIVLSNNDDNYTFNEVNVLLETGIKIEFLLAENEIETAFILGKMCANKKDTDNIKIILPQINDSINRLLKQYVCENKSPIRRKKTVKRLTPKDEVTGEQVCTIEKEKLKKQKEQIKKEEPKDKIKTEDNCYTKKLSKYIEYDKNSNLNEDEFYNRIAECFNNNYQDIVQYGLLKGKFEKEVAEKILVQIESKVQIIQSICKSEDK